MMEDEILVVNNLSACYGNNNVIRNVGFTMKNGEFNALLGLNGSGKTTLLRAICSLKKASTGNCLVNGKDILGMNEKNRARLISYVPQRHSIVYDISVMDMVLMGFNAKMKFYQAPGKKHQLLAVDSLEKLGIGMLANKSFLSLSEGQKQLVILARSMVQNSPVMLLDEPDSALDFVNRHLVLSKIRETIKLGNCCGLITLHDPNFALQYCDRLFLLSGGSIYGEINNKSTIGNIKSKLGKIYGDIDLLKYNGCFVMVRSESVEERI